jgi:hypothetical protein
MVGKYHSLLARLRHPPGPNELDPSVLAKEPCAVCGEETAVGSVFYSDRHTIDHGDGRRTFLCTLCDERVRSSRPGKRLTDDEVREIDSNGVLAIYTTITGPGRSIT